jgi:hypothetical protein
MSINRRGFLSRLGGGLGLAALADLLHAQDPFAPRPPHFAPRARHIIYLIMNGGMSQVDTFDPKPALTRYHGQAMPGRQPKTERITGSLMRSPFQFHRHGQSGIEVSEIFPNVGRLIDRFTVIRSMHTDVPNHEPSLFLMNCGAIQPGRPSLGSWLTYGLGTENRNLPGYIVLCPGTPVVGPPLWESAFLPAVFQGTFVKAAEMDPRQAVQFLDPAGRDAAAQRRQVDLLETWNRRHLEARPGDSELEAAIQSMETAFRMQTEVPEVFDIGQEPEQVRRRYGDSAFARGCLMALRLVEKGVRMVQIYYGNSQPWDAHDDIQSHKTHARVADPAVASLVEDLEARGLLQETLVILGTEFGRTPAVENSALVKLQNGRDHNSAGYSILVAGGGVKGGYVHGATDEFGYRAAEKPVHNHDLNATLLHLMGLDHTRLTYTYSGRDFRLTDVHGEVVHEMLA